MDQSTGVGVLDKIDLLLAAVHTGPKSLSQLVATTEISRPTAHRLARALEQRRYLTRDDDGRFMLGTRIAELAATGLNDWLAQVSGPVLSDLREDTSESAQLFSRRGEQRLCLAAVEPPSGLRDSVPAGTLLPMTAGSAAQVLAAWGEPRDIELLSAEARFTERDLARVRRRGWAHSVAEREPGLSSISAPVRAATDAPGVIAAVSISGPLRRIGRNPRPELTDAVLAAADRLTSLVAERG